MGNGILRVYQEDWFPFQSLPSALQEFTARTGIRTELSWDTVGVGTIEHMFEQMVASFASEIPAYDVVCTDEIILRRMARSGDVLDIGPKMARDDIDLGDVSESTRQAVQYDGKVLGLPCVNVSSMLLCRRDLLDRYGLPLPSDWAELRTVAATLQDAVRKDTGEEFYGFETRGAPGGGHAVWTIGSFLGSHGVRWLSKDGATQRFGDAHATAVSAYLDLIRTVCPPEQAEISFGEMRRDYQAGRVGIIMDVGMEYAHILANNPAYADISEVALVPAGPAGRAPNLYAPPWAIPARTDMADEAWELVKFLASDTRLMQDGLDSNAVETSSSAVLYSPEFDRHFRPDILSAVRCSRAVACEERPFSDAGIEVCEVVGNALSAAIVQGNDAETALRAISDGFGKLADEGLLG